MSNIEEMEAEKIALSNFKLLESFRISTHIYRYPNPNSDHKSPFSNKSPFSIPRPLLDWLGFTYKVIITHELRDTFRADGLFFDEFFTLFEAKADSLCCPRFERFTSKGKDYKHNVVCLVCNNY